MAPSRGHTALSAIRIGEYVCARCSGRAFSATALSASGHNRWSKIKHDKGKSDAARNKTSSMFAQEIMMASKLFGPEPGMNPKLADLITKAKKDGFPKTSIEAAIARGQGRSSTGAALENVTIEAMLPGSVGLIVECETEFRAKTLMDVRLAVKNAGGTVTPCAFLFSKRGRIVFEQKEGVGAEEVLEAALDAGVTDVEEEEDGRVVLFSEPEDTKAVGEVVAQALGLDIATSGIVWCPNEETQVGVTSEQAGGELGAFVDALRENDNTVSAIAINASQGSMSDSSWSELQSKVDAR